MGKNKRQKLTSKPARNSKQKHRPSSNPTSKPSKPSQPTTKSKPSSQHAHPILPFFPSDSILLIGEGDLSFARSLIFHNSCQYITATVLEKSLSELKEKYPYV